MVGRRIFFLEIKRISGGGTSGLDLADWSGGILLV